MGFTVGLSGVVKPNRKPKAKVVDNGPSVLSLMLRRLSTGQPWGFSLTSGGVVDGVTDDSPAAKAVRSPGLNPNALRCGDKIVAVHSPPAGGKVPFSKSAIAAALTFLDITVERSKRASNSSNKASAAKQQKSAAKQPSKQKEAWQAYHREKLLKDLPKWKCGHKEDMHKRLEKVFKSYPDLGGDPELINCVTDHYSPWFVTGLNYANKELCDDRDVVLRAVSKGSAPTDGNKAGNALGFASARLQDDKEVVLAAIQVKADAIWYASDRLQADLTVQTAAKAVLEAYLKDSSPKEKKDDMAKFCAELAGAKRKAERK